ncbi:sulfite exporter TauE/SafE family protein [Anaeromyxobacter terrae]|uniref:sulfite exporter TauE/SafE family protein n=1 Tax=Anaeromyxobacter terrae TaxID=2925406 RepID=UPI001F58DE7B|nr:sulfite exporter TauE/SafE family protein [Anaeromyxobacter sp. SG22]
MSFGEVVLLSSAAFAAGALNAVAGGGSFLTLPALVVTGAAPLAANATGTFALLPGYLSGTWGFREELRPPPGLSFPALLALGAAGGALGAALLLLTPAPAFRRIVPWLLLAATAIFAFAPRLLRAARAGGAGARGAAMGVLAVSVYGGYFNGGLGVLLLALFALLGQTNLNAMNGLKNLLSAVLSAIAVGLYAWGGIILWREGALMMVGSIAGGYLGARVARHVRGAWLRGGIVATGLAMASLFWLRG